MRFETAEIRKRPPKSPKGEFFRWLQRKVISLFFLVENHLRTMRFEPQCAIWKSNVLFEIRIGATHLKKIYAVVFYQWIAATLLMVWKFGCCFCRYGAVETGHATMCRLCRYGAVETGHAPSLRCEWFLYQVQRTVSFVEIKNTINSRCSAPIRRLKP